MPARGGKPTIFVPKKGFPDANLRALGVPVGTPYLFTIHYSLFTLHSAGFDSPDGPIIVSLIFKIR